MTNNKQTDSTQINTLNELDREILDFDLAHAPHGMTLSAQELYMLLKAGYEPVQLVTGNIVYSMGLRGLTRTVTRAFKRGEMRDFTRMNQDARDIARNRMLESALALGATDVIDVMYEGKEYADFIEITAIGTAVRRVRPLEEIEVVIGQ